MTLLESCGSPSIPQWRRASMWNRCVVMTHTEKILDYQQKCVRVRLLVVAQTAPVSRVKCHIVLETPEVQCHIMPHWWWHCVFLSIKEQLSRLSSERRYHRAHKPTDTLNAHWNTCSGIYKENGWYWSEEKKTCLHDLFRQETRFSTMLKQTRSRFGMRPSAFSCLWLIFSGNISVNLRMLWPDSVCTVT